jgi:cell division initiation protein
LPDDRLEQFMTPEEIRHVRLERTLRGYDPRAVDALLEELASSFEELSRERSAQSERVAKLERELEDQGQLQHLMSDALLSAQRAADDLRMRTQQECDAMLESARAEVEQIQAGAREERERIEGEVRRLQASERELRASYHVLLHAALERLGDVGGEEAPVFTPTLLDALAPRLIAPRAAGEPEESQPGPMPA